MATDALSPQPGQSTPSPGAYDYSLGLARPGGTEDFDTRPGLKAVGEVKHALIAGATSDTHEFEVTVAHDSPFHAGSFFIVTDDQDKDRNRVCSGV